MSTNSEGENNYFLEDFEFIPGSAIANEENTGFIRKFQRQLALRCWQTETRSSTIKRLPFLVDAQGEDNQMVKLFNASHERFRMVKIAGSPLTAQPAVLTVIAIKSRPVAV
jgi:hypothetical protein